VIEKSEGVMLRTVPYAESSLIARIYTRREGLQSFIMGGARKTGKGGAAALFQPLTAVDLVYYQTRQRGLRRLKEIAPRTHYQTIPYEVEKVAIAIFIAELLSLSVKEGESDEDLFDFLENAIRVLDEKETGYEAFHLLFMVKLTRFLGIYPNDDAFREGCRFSLSHGTYVTTTTEQDIQLDAGQTGMLHRLQHTAFEDLDRLGFARRERTALLDSLVLYCELQLRQQMKMKSHRILQEAFG
jgi:DNA repair protein RecO (recombination protein O)